MAIRIKGTIGAVPVDLEIDGISSEFFSQLGQVFNNEAIHSGTTNNEAINNESTFASDCENQSEKTVSDNNNARNAASNNPMFSGMPIDEAVLYVKSKTEVSSGELIEFLSTKGCSDADIKRTMMLLREDSEIKTKQGSDFQRIYFFPDSTD
ncbi:hypothetical protein [Sessilibacter corallicola]|uniref:hypothetical protein n=1 Tax=Sessilibacter corallicola TaxID=2904075 RepID=UPI001E586E59|nr:hypothetical protein [Sessilibacter corallicola]MCE2026985.1 hypothetical protein [Sessilibacter corallicola]